MGLLDGKRLLITGVLTDASLAFAVARLAQEEGAEIVLSGAGRALSLTKRTARKLPDEPEVLEIDVTSPEQLAAAGEALAERWDRLDGVLHAIGFAPPDCLGNGMFAADWDDVSVALHISAYSLKALVEAFRPLLAAAGADGGASVVGLDFDATVAWPVYDWMGVAKAALESLTRYLAKELGPDGIRVNLVAAGPVRTMAAKSIPGFSRLRGHLGRPGAARLGRPRLRRRGPGLHRPLQRPVPHDHRRDPPRRRRCPRRSMRSARHRGRRIILLAIAALVALFLVLTAVLFVWPATNAPRRSDAIVVLGGSGPRIQKGLALARAGYAPYLVISDPDDEPMPLGDTAT